MLLIDPRCRRSPCLFLLSSLAVCSTTEPATTSRVSCVSRVLQKGNSSLTIVRTVVALYLVIALSYAVS